MSQQCPDLPLIKPCFLKVEDVKALNQYLTQQSNNPDNDAETILTFMPQEHKSTLVQLMNSEDSLDLADFFAGIEAIPNMTIALITQGMEGQDIKQIADDLFYQLVEFAWAQIVAYIDEHYLGVSADVLPFTIDQQDLEADNHLRAQELKRYGT